MSADFSTLDLAAIASRAAGSVQRKARSSASSVSQAVSQAVALWLLMPPQPVMAEDNDGQTRALPASLVPDTSRNGITALAKAVNRRYGAAFAGQGPVGGPALFVWLSDYTPNVSKHPDADATVRMALRPFVPKSATSAKVKEGHTIGEAPADIPSWVALVEQAPSEVQDLLSTALGEIESGQLAKQTA